MTEQKRNCCRVCETDSDEVRGIYEEVHNGKRAVDMLEYWLQQPIDTSECFPVTICVPCTTKLVECYEFLVLYKKSEQNFLLLYHDGSEMAKNPIKIENDEVAIYPDVDTEYVAVESGVQSDLKTELDYSSEEKSLEEPITLTSPPENSEEDPANPFIAEAQKTFECLICGKVFLHKRGLYRHSKRHTSQMYDCNYCNESFGMKGELRSHCTNMHMDEIKAFKCNQCSEQFPLKSMLKSHLPIHNPTTEKNTEFQCDICLKYFTRRSTLKIHKRLHTGEKPFNCDLCDRTFSSKSAISHHMAMHRHKMLKHLAKNETIIYECFYCKINFNQINNLSRHLREHPILNRIHFECSICKTKFKSERWMFEHKKMHTKLIHNCEYCERSFETKPDLKRHVTLAHDQNELKTYKCNQCVECFPLQSLLNSHLKCHDPEQQHLCAECGKIFQRPSSLQKHLSSHSNDKPFSCTKCPGKFKSMNDLKIHSVVHMTERKYACDQCGKTFIAPRALKVHKLTHTDNNRRFQCETCLKRFPSNYKLTEHTRTHTGEKPFKCEFCDRAYTQSGDLKKHRRIHVGMFPYKCNECDQSFRLETELRKHSYQHFKTGEN